MLSLRNALVVAILFVPLNAFGDDNPPGAASPDNRRNAVGEDKSIRVFDVATGKEVIRIQAHTAKVTALALSSATASNAAAKDGQPTPNESA